jgi:hypothetical protein
VRSEDRDVRRQPTLEELGIIGDSAPQLRAELPVAVPAPSEGDFQALGEPLGIREVARLIGCSVWTVRQQCLRQGLPHFRASRSGRFIFYRNQTIRWLIERQTERRW